MTDGPYYVIGPNELMLPPDPASEHYHQLACIIISFPLQILTDRELLSCHAEIKSLQAHLGISYKDASHRLYLAEIEKFWGQNITMKTYAQLRGRVDDNLRIFESRLSGILTSPDADA